MISETFSMSEFITAVKDKNDYEILRLARSDIAAAESRSFGRKGAVEARGQGSTRYAADLKGLVWFLEQGIVSATKPMGVSMSTFSAFRPIIVSLVERDIMEPEALDQFRKAAQNAPDRL